MSEVTTRLVEELARKLGTTAEHLWGVLVRQAPIDGVCKLLPILMLLCVFAAWLRVTLVKTRTLNEHGYPLWDDEAAVCAWVAVAVLILITIVAVSADGPTIAAAFWNPEYWALKQIIN